MKKTLFVQIVSVLLCVVSLQAQISFDQPTQVFLMHSSGNHLEKDGNGRGVLKAPNTSGAQMMTFIPDRSGYYSGGVLGRANPAPTVITGTMTETLTTMHVYVRCSRVVGASLVGALFRS